MPRVDLDDFYRRALAEHGETAEGVQWTSTEKQEQRFAALRRLLPTDLSPWTVVDVGCGLGDFYLYLARHDAAPGEYLGVDLVAPMVTAARARTGCTILHRDALCDPLPEGDFYVCSGAMNNLTPDETKRFIERCWAASRRGFVFNLLRGTDRPGAFAYWLPEAMLTFGQALGAEVRLLDDYLCYDFSIALRRPPVVWVAPVDTDATGGA